MAPCGNKNAVGNKGGRPTKYTPELGDELIGWMEAGYSLSATAAKMGYHRDTLYEWAKRHPEFSDTIKRAKGLRLFKLESDLLQAPDSPTVTSRIFALKTPLNRLNCLYRQATT